MIRITPEAALEMIEPRETAGTTSQHSRHEARGYGIP
jgi:hypothetical protein